MANYGPKKAVKKSSKSAPVITEAQSAEDMLVTKILSEKQRYFETSQSRRTIWAECWRMYMSKLDETRNPYLANLFIPKTHEAVEILAAFLAGPNQSIHVSGEGVGDIQKGQIANRYLEFLWRKVVRAREKVVTWIKQAILFGNGILKCGWDADKGVPCLEVLSITDVLFDFHFRNIQESPSVIHVVKKLLKDVQNDEQSYNENRKNVVATSEYQVNDPTEAAFASAEALAYNCISPDVTLIFERWTTEEIVTIAPTSSGYKIIRQIPNNYKDASGNSYMPFVKLRMKSSPLPNRAYDFGAIEPTLRIQKAFNDMLNEILDNVSLINQKMWIKRKGASINPIDMVRRPGGIIEVDDINADLKSDEMTDIKASALEVLRLLDNEFQQASMVVNILKGVGDSRFAAEVATEQANITTLLSLIDDNIKEGLSQAGQMLLDIAFQYEGDTDKIVKLLENDDTTTIAEFKISEIKGMYDVKVSAERPIQTSAAVRQKQLLDFLAIVSKDPAITAKYPTLTAKVYKKWLENGGEGDPNYYFEDPQTAPAAAPTPALPSMPGVSLPDRGAGLTPGAIERSATIPTPTP
jgi:hypothetical protein